MPLDTSDFGSSHAALALGSDFASLRRDAVVLNPDGNLGAALREAREHLGLAVMDIASVTRVRAAHLGAIEAFDLDRLPARPFTVGYVRAYASALGLDGDAVAARFRDEAPRLDSALRAPCGIHPAPRRLGWWGVTGLLIVSAVLAWNLFRHAQASASATATRSGQPASLRDARPRPHRHYRVNRGRRCRRSPVRGGRSDLWRRRPKVGARFGNSAAGQEADVIDRSRAGRRGLFRPGVGDRRGVEGSAHGRLDRRCRQSRLHGGLRPGHRARHALRSPDASGAPSRLRQSAPMLGRAWASGGLALS